VKHEEFRKKVLSRPGAPARVAALKTSILRDQALEELRHTHEITQQDLGDVMGLSQKRVSQLEHQDDARVSTVRATLKLSAAICRSLPSSMVSRFQSRSAAKQS
jgi:DNA-binding XRE family transcriptional regulator